MRVARLLSIQMLLETRGQMSARELAEALEVSVRTLHRDVDHLSAAGVPIVADRGRLGGFRLLDGWNTRLTGLTPSEAQAVFLSGLAGPADQLGLSRSMQSAQLKLLTSLPAAWREDARRVHSRIHLDPVDWYRESDAVPHLTTVADAIWKDRQMRIHYQSWTAERERVVDPLGLVLKAGTWYFLANSDGGTRTFRVAGLRTATLLETRVKRPRGFDLAREWAESVARFETALYTDWATVISNAVGLVALSQLNVATARAVRGAPASLEPGALVTVRIPIESIAHATPQLIALAPDVTVVEPKSLRAAIKSRLRRISSKYE